MNFEATTILNNALDIYSGKKQWPLSDFNWAQGFSERSIESTWLADRLRSAKSGDNLLDIGFSLSSLDTLGLLLEVKKQGANITALDIISPERVISRYPEEWRTQIREIPYLEGDIRTYDILSNAYDTITCISTLEHVGFDEAGKTEDSAFNRLKNSSEIILDRAPETTTIFMDQVHKALKNNGRLLLTLPYGIDAPRLLRDSLGYFCAYWENGSHTLDKIINHPGFIVESLDFFLLNNESIWDESNKELASDVKDCLFKPVTDACVTIELKKT